MSHFAPDAGTFVRTDRPAWLGWISGRAALIAAAALVCVLAAASVVVVERFGRTRPVAQRPYIRDLSKAPAAARPLITQIAQRNDAQCFGRSTGAASAIDTSNAQSLDYVAVSQVSSDQKSVLLSVVCVFASADPLTLTTAGWIEGGTRQLAAVSGAEARYVAIDSVGSPSTCETVRND